MPRKPTQSSAYAASPRRRPGRPPWPRPRPRVDVDAGGSTSAQRPRRDGATEASWKRVSASWLSGTQPSPRRTSARRTRRSTAATAGLPSAGVVRHDRRDFGRRRPGAERQHRVGAPRGRGRRGAQQPARRPPSGSATRSGHSANARSWASRGETRSRGEGRGGTGLPVTMSASADRDGGPVSGGTRHTPSRPAPGRCRARRSSPGRPTGPVSPGQHAAYDDALSRRHAGPGRAASGDRARRGY